MNNIETEQKRVTDQSLWRKGSPEKEETKRKVFCLMWLGHFCSNYKSPNKICPKMIFELFTLKFPTKRHA